MLLYLGKMDEGMLWDVTSGPGLKIQDFTAGTRVFERFTLEKFLGKGDIGVVWLARDERPAHRLALKFVPAAFHFEGRRKSLRLAHPNIVRILGFIDGGEIAAVVMEFVDGSTLSELRLEKRANCFAVGEIAPWVASLCDALAYAHASLGLIYHDLKPSNLMVNERKELKVTSFGLTGTLRDAEFAADVSTNNGGLHYGVRSGCWASHRHPRTTSMP